MSADDELRKIRRHVQRIDTVATGIGCGLLAYFLSPVLGVILLIGLGCWFKQHIEAKTAERLQREAEQQHQIADVKPAIENGRNAVAIAVDKKKEEDRRQAEKDAIDEDTALAKYKDARDRIINGDHEQIEQAKKDLEAIVVLHSKTQAAKKAKDLLDKLPK